MIETNITLHWNVNTPTQDIQDTIGLLEAILDKKRKDNVLGYTIHDPKVV